MRFERIENRVHIRITMWAGHMLLAMQHHRISLPVPYRYSHLELQIRERSIL